MLVKLLSEQKREHYIQQITVILTKESKTYYNVYNILHSVI
jgi:hypothetical protein